jgi:PIN like domain
MRNKSKRLSAGKPEQLRLEDFIVFLDENLHRRQPLLDVLAECQVSFRRHEAEGFAPGEEDDVWLPYVSERGWVVLTKDKKNRYNDLERSAVLRFKTREFYFGAGSLNKFDMACALRVALPEMKRIVRRYVPPVICSIARSGAITVVFDEKGSTHERRQMKARKD